MANTSLLETDLSVSPYFDDYNPSKQFYAVLFKPGVPVQTRELNQLQTILQDQIRQFGTNIFKDGSVISGCDFTFDPRYAFVKLKDTYANSTALTVSDLNNLYVYNTRGLRAVVVNTVAGLESADPDFNTIYLKYIDGGNATYANGSAQKKFDANEELFFETGAGTPQGSVVTPDVENVSGYGYALHVNEGYIFKKGYFIYVTPQVSIVTKYDNNPDNISVGFEAIESITTSSNDESLLDNAAGAPNYTAPGADRLKLSPVLVSKSSDVASDYAFFSICDFRDGLPITLKTTTEFNSVQREVARRTFETNGNFVVNPFRLNSTPLANTSDPQYSTHFNLAVSKGLGYSEGYRVEFLNNQFVKVRKGTDYTSITGKNIGLNMGQYYLINEVSGEFGDSSQIIRVELHNVAKQSVTGCARLGVSRSTTTIIGYAYVKGFIFSSGIQGTPEGQYKLYVFDLEMNAGYSPSDVKSIIHYSGGINGVADIVLDYSVSAGGNVAYIKNTNLSTLLFPTGQFAVKNDSFENIVFNYRRISTGTFASNGVATIIDSWSKATGADETFVHSGDLSASQSDQYIIIPTENGYIANGSGTVTVFTDSGNVVGSGTSFNTNFVVGDYIDTSASGPKKIIRIESATKLYVSSNSSSSGSGLGYRKAYPVGAPISFGDRTYRRLSVSSNTLTINLGDTLVSGINFQIIHPVKRSSTTSIHKNINREVYVKIDCSSHTNGKNGPWNLGIPDAKSILGVYIGDTYSTSNPEYSAYFEFDDGQRDSYYGLSSLKINNQNIKTRLNDNSKILVKMSAFTHDKTQGVGFFNANSYPIDDTTPGATNTILTAEIPTYISDAGTFYDLRDNIDFRLIADNTAVVATSVSTATVNPSSTLTFTGTPYLPEPDSSFTTDMSYYLKRIDRVSIDINSKLVITEGIPGDNIVLPPPEKSQSMTLGFIGVTPYPSLSAKEASTYDRQNLAITTSEDQIRRYTMKDIGQFDKRIKVLEYYSSLNLLESSASTLQIRNSSTGLNRYQNGIFVDNFADFKTARPGYKNFNIAIDSGRTLLRPAFMQVRSEFNFNSDLSSGVQQTGNLITLPYTEVEYINQLYATKYRNCIEGNIYNQRGTITLTPDHAAYPDITNAPNPPSANLDLYSNWAALDNAWGSQWNNWSFNTPTDYTRTLISGTQTVNQQIDGSVVGGGTYDGSTNGLSDAVLQTAGPYAGQYVRYDVDGNPYIQYATVSGGSAWLPADTAGTLTTTTTQTLLQRSLTVGRTGNDLNVAANNQNYGWTYLSDIGLTTYIPTTTIQFEASGLKPNVRLYAYFDNTPVSNYCAMKLPGYDYSTTAGQQLVGQAGYLISDNNGNCSGVFTIIANTFRSGELQFLLNDIESLEVGKEAITTSAEATFYGRTLNRQNTTYTLNTTQAVLTSRDVVDGDPYTFDYLQIGTNVTQQFTPSQPYYGGGGCGCGCFVYNSFVELSNGKKVKISEIKIGDKVYNYNKTKINTVKFIEKMDSSIFDYIYSPSKEILPFATSNHPLYVNDVLSNPNPDLVNEWYPWLGKVEKLENINKGDVYGDVVYNLWVDGDGTYIVNDYGTTSIIGDGGGLRRSVEFGLIDENRAVEIVYNYIKKGRSTIRGIYEMNKIFAKIDSRILNKIILKSFVDKKYFDVILKVIGKFANVFDRNK